jgi:hypothetical protein
MSKPQQIYKYTSYLQLICFGSILWQSSKTQDS